MVEKIKNKLRRANRRRFLQTLATLGVAGPALNSATQKALANLDYDPDHEVPRIKKWVHTNHEEVKKGAFPRREPVYYTISRDKWARVETAENAARRLEERLGNEFNSKSFSVGVRLGRNDGYQRREVVVEHITVERPNKPKLEPSMSFETLRDSVPSRVSGTAGAGSKYETTWEDIPVSVEQVTEKPERAENYSSYYDLVPGGCYHETESVSGYVGFGTLGTPAKKNSDNSPILVTCGHTFENDDDGTLEKNEVHQDTYEGGISPNFVGYVNQFQSQPDFDMATVGLDGGSRGIKWDMAANGGNYKGYDINGAISRQYLNDNLGTTLEKQGSSTGTVNGDVKEVGSTWVKIDATNSAVGDSGGPYYETTHDPSLDYTSCEIAAIHRGTTDDDNLQKGTLMESIEGTANITV